MTINSMTAFARESEDTGAGSLVVEIRSVNHRYLDCYFKLPEQMRGLESGWRQLLQAALSRGKVEIQLRWQAELHTEGSLELNTRQLTALLDAVSTVEQSAQNLAPATAIDILQWPGVLQSAADSKDAVSESATRVFKRALETLTETRAREGQALAEIIGSRLQQVSGEVASARAQLPQLLAQQRARLESRLAELDLDVEPGRLEQELVLIAQKADVEEELDRLEAHVQEVARVLGKGGPCGRRLDFLMQELNREANTLSSKSIATGTTQNAVELKVLIEQMREQIQNIE